MLNPSRMTVSAASYGGPSSYAAGAGKVAGSNGSAGSIVVYTVTYTQPFLTGIPALLTSLAPSSGLGASLTHTATVVVQNEPY